MENKPFIPVCEPYLAGNELAYVTETIETGWISSAGKYIQAFEDLFAKYLGVKHAISTTNGTTALHLSLIALGLKEGDEVIIPNFTMIASAFAVAYTGAKPVFVDSEMETWNIDPDKIEEKITSRTKAIMPVHIWGHPCNMKPIYEVANKYGIKILEDAAEAHGAEYLGKKCGTLGDIAAFSFFANKIATTGEGGMVVTNDDELADQCRYYKNLCFPLKGTRNYQHNHIGFNYRMSNVIAAIGYAQVEKLNFYVEQRRKLNRLYRSNLCQVKGITFQSEMEYAKNVYWMNAIVIDEKQFGISRDKLMTELKAKGIDSRLFFTGMHKQKSLKDFGADCSGSYPVSDLIENNGMYLPSASNLTADQISYISEQIILLDKS